MVGPQRAADKLILPGPELTVGSAPKSLPVLHRDWHRIERELIAGEERWPPFAHVGTACVGISVSALFGWIGWGPVYDGLTVTAKQSNVWQGSLLGLAVITFGIVAGVMFLAEWIMRGRRAKLRTLAQEDMKEVFDAATVGEVAD